MRLIDLSLTLEATPSEPVPVEIEYIDHARGADILGQPIGIDRNAFPEKMGLSLEYVRCTTHSGTHIDAPHHYGVLCEGKPAKTIDELPLDWFFHPGVRLDCRRDSVDQSVGVSEIQEQLREINYRLKPFDIVLLYTGAEEKWGEPEYFTHFRGVSREATAWLIEQGIKVIGVDSFGFDPPFGQMLDRYRQQKRQDVLWPAHFYGRQREYCQIERLTNLAKIPVSTGFTVACFPIKVRGCGAGWSRVVAIVPESSD
ncbi:MAG: cyclase family protein [Microcystis sp. M015S2]|jgi:kynurenine formamidase|uniref:cyclase family protein n=1 Tax=unclassified Microcystis TaxID=2643300 RepID=UPI0022CAA31D|nr:MULTISPECIES: cyclase family protein [unclassified Microcystis]MCZ8306435.1 cyclase family protein [Microcystis sp. LE19-98.1E]MCA2693152.1 cyclase family protein [Microcystis sp. M034S2]MCA2711294.1 cyclase family protein [Microcystis sp. M025S2]MCA2743591.1 cyclase family protein [Microcystis sp. M015S2]MCA2751399.1 cyclase family protein [Microcystis sp. M144S2]